MKPSWLIVVAVAAACWGQTVPDPKAMPDPKAAQPDESQPAIPAGTSHASPGSTSTTAVKPQDAMAASRAAMEAAIEKQRASVVKQVGSATGKTPPPSPSFFTVPWVESPPQFVGITIVPPCDPLPNSQLDPLIEENAKRESVRADLIRAVIGQESGSRPCAMSSKGAQGLMQLMPATAEQFGIRDPFDPKQNVEAGTKLLKQLLTKYGGDLRLALSAYNAGSDRVDKDGGVPQIPETMNYVTEIMSKLSQ